MGARPELRASGAEDVAVFHPGVQHSWQTALALEQLGRLSFYATSIFYQPERWPYRIERYLPAGLADRAHAEFARFAGPALPLEKVATVDATEWLERIARRAGAGTLALRLDRLGNRRFVRGLSRVVAQREPTVLWGYNGSSRETFEASRNRGRLKVLDRTIGDWRVFNDRMAAVRRDWLDFFLSSAHGEVNAAQIARDDAEYAAADVILAGSPHAADTIKERAHDQGVAAKVQVLPYCFDEALFGAPRTLSVGIDRPVRFLFLGQAAPRKGIHLLLEAARHLSPSDAAVTIVGGLEIPRSTFARYADRVTLRAGVPRRDVPAIMAAHDVLVFPSYFEGSALSLLEALASGLAIIQSREAGLGATTDTGLVLPELGVEALVAAMRTLIEDRAKLHAFRQSAPVAARPYRFAAYRERIETLLAGQEPRT